MHKRKNWHLIPLLLIISLLITVPITAQEATQEATAGLEALPEDLYLVSAELLFPNEVRFKLVVEIPATELAFMEFTVGYPGQDNIVMNLNPQDAGVTNPYTEYQVNWSVPTTNPPDLFEEIVYQWRVVTQRDRIIDYQGAVIYTDTRTRWRVDEDPAERLNFTFPLDGPNIASIRNGLDDFYGLLESNLGNREALNILLYPENLTPGCDLNNDNEPVHRYLDIEGIVELPCDIALANRIFEQSGYLVMTFRSNSQLEDELVNLAFARFYDPLWQNVTVPEWFKAGLKQFYLPQANYRALANAQQSVRVGQALTAEVMAIPPTERNKQIWEAQSYGMVLYTARLIGVDALFDFAENLGQNDENDVTNFEDAYATAVGATVSGVIRAWENWIFTPDAESSYGYTPFNPETPTPTVTSSPTPVPPTATFTSTPTPTVTGVLSPTPSDTPTASRTPIPPTPTVTPRRVGAILIAPTSTPLPSPTPSPVSQLTDQPAGPIGTVLVGVVFVLLAIAGVIFLNRTRNY